jgi:4-hydroxy-2-oxoheptanedioate aldolase
VKLRERLRDRCVYGTIIGSPARPLIDAVASGGLDFILIDHMHSAIDWESASALAATARAAGLAAFYRPSHSPGLAGGPAYLASQSLRALSVGFDGLFVSIADESEAEAVCEVAEHYWQRGAGGAPSPEERQRAREGLFVVAQFESVGAVEHLDQVARTPGLDGLAVANSDITLEVTDRLDADDNRVVSVIERVHDACERHGLSLWCNTGYGFPALTDMAGRAERLRALRANMILFQSAEFVLQNALKQILGGPDK